MRVMMLTGDSHLTAKMVARRLGLPASEVRAQMMPSGKSDAVKALQAEGEVVAMVGDGINDAPALAQADLGISVGTGTEIATAQADIVLIKSNILDVLTALDLSQAVCRRIRMNFVWALGYNTLGIPFAAGVAFPFLHCTLPPQMAGLALAMSSVSVVLSSLSLKAYRKPLVCRQFDEEGRISNGGSAANMVGTSSSTGGSICGPCLGCLKSAARTIKKSKEQIMYRRLSQSNAESEGGSCSVEIGNLTEADTGLLEEVL